PPAGSRCAPARTAMWASSASPAPQASDTTRPGAVAFRDACPATATDTPSSANQTLVGPTADVRAGHPRNAICRPV
ncbi:hypothetical protein IscW_ISCW014691, partial [Ixodes scapularis]